MGLTELGRKNKQKLVSFLHFDFHWCRDVIMSCLLLGFFLSLLGGLQACFPSSLSLDFTWALLSLCFLITF